MTFNFDLAWVQPVLLAAVRFTVFILLAPPFNNTAFPAAVKAMLAVGFALAVSPKIVGGAQLSDGAFMVSFVMQVLIGLALAVLVRMIFSAVDSAGALLDQFGGFSLASAYNPQAQLQAAPLGQLFNVVAAMLLFTSGAYRILIMGLARSFVAFPIGATFHLNGLVSSFVSGVGNSVLAAVEIAGPLVIVLFLTDIALGLITRVAPQTNVFSLGFPLKVLVTLGFIGLVVAVLPTVMTSLTDEAAKVLGVSG